VSNGRGGSQFMFVYFFFYNYLINLKAVGRKTYCIRKMLIRLYGRWAVGMANFHKTS